MDALPVPSDDEPEPLTGSATWFTSGSWATEAESASAFDRRIEALSLFRVYREISGTLIHPRPGQGDRSVRIDRLLVPTGRLLAMGWKHRTIGVEIKRSGVNIGPAFGQAKDYVNSVFDLDGLAWIMPSFVFLWPMDKASGPLSSFMASSRVGSATFSGSDTLKFALGEEVLFADNIYSGARLGTVRSGHKVGSR